MSMDSKDSKSSQGIKWKVCGLKSLVNMELVLELQPDWVGLNFVPSSPRKVTLEEAKALKTEIKHSQVVGIFAKQSLEEIKAIHGEIGFDLIQLHGGESPAFVQALNLPTMLAIQRDQVQSAFLSDYAKIPSLQYFLVDSIKQGSFGGTGEAVDWSGLNDFDWPKPFLLAGGLSPLNLENAIRTVFPYGVDLNSKIESQPGIKDIVLLKQCIDIIKKFSV